MRSKCWHLSPGVCRGTTHACLDQDAGAFRSRDVFVGPYETSRFFELNYRGTQIASNRRRGNGHEPGTTLRVSNSLVWMRDRPLSRIGDESRSLLRGRERYAMRAPRASA